MSYLIKKFAIAICTISVVLGPVFASENHVHHNSTDSWDSVSFEHYMEQIRLRTNSLRELPDLNLNGWRNMVWHGVVSHPLKAGDTANADALVMSLRRSLKITAEGRLVGVEWRNNAADKNLDDVLGELKLVYGTPSEHHFDGKSVWRGTHSVLELLAQDEGFIIRLLPATD